MWDCNDSKDLVIELFNNKNNDELYYVDMDIMKELNEVNWKYL
jgi:hypothetical protein